ncbi:glycine betaine/L-proline ABC transporter ATP-binding protein [Herbiconiux sp. VKM Ac-2851]|uniref:quaternary amine ABC transporter ATP-binding protein n=1 Tax=Herbiconiux sp. VKM Ac-2851 TaxID=2739025 RepID=UPI0015677611|nr:glycine betaine/L-proline ABC transporter ATP-binding protein [Herbiconiux sp. VKM Ac-2851]NQX37172.1 glycine betaine/L-proline ABC transporter ATP-binding protein [Herbiconiux sp. VKM Ac-2851]
MPERAAVEVTNLYKIFGRKPHDAVRRLREGASRDEVSKLGTAAVIDASFTVEPGEIFVVMGLSGSGKSTLIRTLNGLLEPTAGDVSIMGTSVGTASTSELRELRRNHVSMVFQHFALLPHRTVAENVAYGLEIQGVSTAERRSRAGEILDLVGLGGWGDKLPDELSGGMRQRVGLGRALAADTDVLLMDEAFSALDPLIRREMQEQLLELQTQLGKTIVFITHDLNEAMFLGDRVAVMRDGRVVQVDTPEQIITDPASEYVEKFVHDVDRARVLTAASIMEPGRSVISLSSGPRAAMRRMRDLQTSAAFVIGPNRTLLGTVHDRAVMSLVTSGESDLSAVVQDDYLSAAPETPISELVELSIESVLPVAVTDADGRLLGVVPRVTLLAALGNLPASTGEIATVDPPATIPIDVITQTLRATGADAPANAMNGAN